MVDKPKENTPVQEPVVDGQPAAGTPKADVQAQPGTPAGKPEWLKENFKSVDEQAKAYSEAEKKMTQATQEAARLREENLKLQAQFNSPAGIQQTPPAYNNMPPNTPQEIPFHVRTMLETKYPGVPAEQIVAMYDMFNVQLQPVKESLYGSQIESAKATFAKENTLYERFKGEIETTLNRYPIEDRGKRNTIETVYAWVVKQHLPELQNEWLEQGKQQASIKPTVPSFTGDTGGTVPPQPASPGSFKLTPEQKAMAEKLGLNPDEVEKINTNRGYK